ncbi:DUF2029 domain-containing protein [Thalassoglobus polymorphus]|uniref:Glycosyltransferase RgtA/B/C/D-like domain-containing protein n=1 Tax=Thalassoglobus polymorphus TaxID=2527994 RepID=A0A517QTT2_9PLAN|nr:DUF2029 domain-containing protein [Thalassoglobus polymorphus]QDT34988.1 hypothetical protein Mal48_42610 [Thalassoglobus polymorphus]
MDFLLPSYSMNQATWFYLSFLLIVAIYFRFMRIFSLRNLDLALLLSASPGLLFVAAQEDSTLGHAWLFVIACVFLLRMFFDPILSRRPYLGQNLNTHGMAFLFFAVCAFLFTQVITSSLPQETEETIAQADYIMNLTATDPGKISQEEFSTGGPAAPIFVVILKLIFNDLAPSILAILAHAAVISGLWFVGRNLFGDKSIGLAMATLYLLLPCTAYNVAEFNHVLPAALVTWAFVAFRKPVVSGVLLGLASGTLLFPVFLLPIWAAFYGRKRAGRFVMALVAVAIVLLASLAFTSKDSDSFFEKTIGTINVPLTALSNQEFSPGFWKDADYVSPYRWPVMASYFIMLIFMTIWPRRRNVEVLLAQSAAAIIGTQLWYTQKGGVYLLWYVPLLLMVIFRPRLTHLKFIEELEESTVAKSPSNGDSKKSSASSTSGKNLQLFR